jgi:pyrroloquinoline-quinone synthase
MTSAKPQEYVSVEEVFARLDQLIESVPVDKNRFYDSFRARDLTKDELQFFADQYFYYIRTFPQILAGLSHRVESETVRVELAKTIVSELGEGLQGKKHFELFQKVMRAVGVEVSDIHMIKHIPESEALVQGLREIFLKEPPIVAIGGHYTIEKVGLGMIHNLYEAFRRYPTITVEDMEYFYLHLFLEADHVAWISEAVKQHIDDPSSRRQLEEGALRVAKLLADFWEGLYQNIFVESVQLPQPQFVSN